MDMDKQIESCRDAILLIGMMPKAVFEEALANVESEDQEAYNAFKNNFSPTRLWWMARHTGARLEHEAQRITPERKYHDYQSCDHRPH